MNSFDYILRSFQKNSSKIISSLLLSAILITCYSCFLHNKAVTEGAISASAQSIDKLKVQDNSETVRQNRETEDKSKPTSDSRARDRSSILESIWKLLKAKREQEPALSSRSNICEIAPGLLGEVNVIYSDRPLFLWQGTLASLEIHLYTPFNLEREQEVFWSQTVESQSQRVLYTGKALAPGQIYDWEIVVAPESNRRRISFQVMEKKKREQISGELEQLETELMISGATDEYITLERANYFAQQDLWSDALQELFSLENSSTTLSGNAQEIVEYLCDSEHTKFNGFRPKRHKN